MRQARARVLTRLVTDERTIDAELRDSANTLRNALGREGIAEASIERIIAREATRTVQRLTTIAEGSVRNGATIGAQLDRETFLAAFGERSPHLDAVTFASDADAARAAAQVIRGNLVADRVSLSGRLWANQSTNAAQMTSEIRSSLRSGESVVAAAERVVRAGDPVVALPRYVRELREAARQAPRAGASIVSRANAAEIERLGAGAAREASALSIRSASQDFARRIASAQTEDVAAIVERWAYEKARYQARLVVRTETVRALRTAYESASATKPYIAGMRWMLSAAHPKADVCDLMASVDQYGLGPGGYPVGSVPDFAHPACLCTTIAIIDEHHFARARARRTGTDEPPREWQTETRQSPADWLRAQPARVRTDILGPGRARLFELEPSSVVRQTGQLVTLREARGELPRTARSERVRVKQTTVGASELSRRPARG